MHRCDEGLLWPRECVMHKKFPSPVVHAILVTQARQWLVLQDSPVKALNHEHR